MQREFIQTWDSTLKTKEWLHLDFDTNISFQKFEEWYDEEKALLEYPISFNLKNQDEVLFLNTIMQVYPADFWLENGKETFEAIDIVRGAILSWLACFFSDKTIIESITKILKWTVIKTYNKNITMEILQELKDNHDLYEYITHIVLNYETSSEWKWWYNQNKDILNTNDFDENLNLFFSLLDNYWYEEDIINDNRLLYVIYCVLFLKSDLYLAYTSSPSWFKISITDEKQLHLYMINWAYVLNISNIISSIYKWIQIEGIENYNSLSKIIEDQTWRKLFQDLKNDSKYKNKVSFT